jgi:hypothetical protein
MKLQALKEAEFKSSSLHVTPVTPRKIADLHDLPTISYLFDVDGEKHHIAYNIEYVNDRRIAPGPNSYTSIARDMINAYAEIGVKMADANRYAMWEGDHQFLAQTLQNMMRQKLRAQMERRRTDGAVIHAQGHCFVPLAQGASLLIYEKDDRPGMDLDRWDVILKGPCMFFGEERQYTINHAHAQGFEFEYLTAIMDDARQSFEMWFPTFKGNLRMTHIEAISNPVSHQDKSVRV